MTKLTNIIKGNGQDQKQDIIGTEKIFDVKVRLPVGVSENDFFDFIDSGRFKYRIESDSVLVGFGKQPIPDGIKNDEGYKAKYNNYFKYIDQRACGKVIGFETLISPTGVNSVYKAAYVKSVTMKVRAFGILGDRLETLMKGENPRLLICGEFSTVIENINGVEKEVVRILDIFGFDIVTIFNPIQETDASVEQELPSFGDTCVITTPNAEQKLEEQVTSSEIDQKPMLKKVGDYYEVDVINTPALANDKESFDKILSNQSSPFNRRVAYGNALIEYGQPKPNDDEEFSTFIDRIQTVDLGNVCAKLVSIWPEAIENPKSDRLVSIKAHVIPYGPKAHLFESMIDNWPKDARFTIRGFCKDVSTPIGFKRILDSIVSVDLINTREPLFNPRIAPAVENGAITLPEKKDDESDIQELVYVQTVHGPAVFKEDPIILASVGNGFRYLTKPDNYVTIRNPDDWNNLITANQVRYVVRNDYGSTYSLYSSFAEIKEAVKIISQWRLGSVETKEIIKSDISMQIALFIWNLLKEKRQLVQEFIIVVQNFYKKNDTVYAKLFDGVVMKQNDDGTWVKHED